jgi:hypothetical protein
MARNRGVLCSHPGNHAHFASRSRLPVTTITASRSRNARECTHSKGAMRSERIGDPSEGSEHMYRSRRVIRVLSMVRLGTESHSPAREEHTARF